LGNRFLNSDLKWRHLRGLLARAIIEPAIFMRGGEEIFKNALISRARIYCIMGFDCSDPENGAMAKKVLKAFELEKQQWETGELALGEYLAQRTDQGYPDEWEKFIACATGMVSSAGVCFKPNPSPFPNLKQR
jgi:hypothetical protein